MWAYVWCQRREFNPKFKAGLAEAVAEAERLGLVMDEGVVSKLDQAGDSAGALAKRFQTGGGLGGGQTHGRLRLHDVVFGGAATFAGKFMGHNGNTNEKLYAAQKAAKDHWMFLAEAREAPGYTAATERTKATYR